MLNRRQVLQVFAAAPLLGAGGTLTARAFDSEGKPADSSKLASLLLINADGRPFELLPSVTGNGTLTVDLPNEDFELMMRLPVRDFGEVYLYARDVTGSDLILNYEFARSRAQVVREYVAAARPEGVRFSAEMMKRLEAGEAALARATAASDLPTRVRHSNDSLTETMWAGEMAVLERARHRIARQGPRPGYLFGAAAFRLSQSDEFAKLFMDLLNFGSVPFYRATTEPTEGNLDYSWADGNLEKTAGTEMIVKGHPLVWMNEASMPDFLRKKSWEDLKASWREYILGTVGRYRARIHSWDIINEAHDWANLLNYEQQQMIELTRLAADTTRVADPTAFRVVNNCCLWADYVATRQVGGGVTLDRPAMTPVEYMRGVRDAGIDYEALGLQVYCPGRDMLEVERHIERFFEFGKPVHITELGIPSVHELDTRGQSVPYPIDAVWHGTEWNEQIQADWVEQFYTLCYSKPEIQAITWWSFGDPGYIPQSGFVRRDGSPKPSYERLRNLIREWQG